jgi:hypothetical protein
MFLDRPVPGSYRGGFATPFCSKPVAPPNHSTFTVGCSTHHQTASMLSPLCRPGASQWPSQHTALNARTHGVRCTPDLVDKSSNVVCAHCRTLTSDPDACVHGWRCGWVWGTVLALAPLLPQRASRCVSPRGCPPACDCNELRWRRWLL